MFYSLYKDVFNPQKTSQSQINTINAFRKTSSSLFYTFKKNVLAFQKNHSRTLTPGFTRTGVHKHTNTPGWTCRGVWKSRSVSPVSIGLSVNLVSRWWRRETSDCRPQRSRSTEPRSRHESLICAAVPVDRQKCLPGHVCLLLQVATGDGQLAVPMERRCGPNKRRREKENQLNLRWPPRNNTRGSVYTEPRQLGWIF